MSLRFSCALPRLLRLFALFEFVYFSLSHWFGAFRVRSF